MIKKRLVKLLLIGAIIGSATNFSYATIRDNDMAALCEYTAIVAETERKAAEQVEFERDLSEKATVAAKIIYCEARGIESTTEKAAVVWCIINRCNEFKDFITEALRPSQFSYRESAPMIDDYGTDLYALAYDVLFRWHNELNGETEVGRVLPQGYKWFSGKQGHNRFRNAYRNGRVWDWSLTSPYTN